jgi:hypothetical protein
MLDEAECHRPLQAPTISLSLGHVINTFIALLRSVSLLFLTGSVLLSRNAESRRMRIPRTKHWLQELLVVALDSLMDPTFYMMS